MTNKDRNSQVVAVSLMVYRLLLLAYPARFRQDYGGMMQQVFGDCCRRVCQQGGLADLARFWIWTFIDYISSVIEENTQRGTDMNKSKFIQLSAWALIWGPVLFFLGLLASYRPEYNPYNARSLPIDRYLNAADIWISVMGFLLVCLGMAGLLLRYGVQSGWFGKLSLSLAFLSGLASISGMILLDMENETAWLVFLWGLTFTHLGLALFVIPCLQRRLLPKWNISPLLAGVWVPGFVFLTGVYESLTGHWYEPPDILMIVLYLATILGFSLLGFSIRSDTWYRAVLSQNGALP
jgi:hypothetical protein